MRAVRVVASVVSVLCLHALTPGEASACSYVGQTWILPQGDAVPTNTRVWLMVSDWEPLVPLDSNPFYLREVDGPAVEVQWTAVPVGERPRSDEDWPGVGVLHVLTPVAPLKLGTTYETGGVIDGMDVGTRFTVTRDADLKPPAVPAEISRTPRASSGSSCGSYAEVTFGYRGFETLDEFFVATLAGHRSFSPDTLQGSLATLGDEDLVLARGIGMYRSWPSSNPASVKLQVGAFDLAGNFSGFGEPSTVKLPALPAGPDEGCAVSTSARGSSRGDAVLLLVGAALAGAVTRSRRRRPR